MELNEAIDLEVMKEKADLLRENAYNLICIMVDAPDLTIYGYHTLENAVRYIIKDTRKDLDKLWKEHTKKFPN